MNQSLSSSSEFENVAVADGEAIDPPLVYPLEISTPIAKDAPALRQQLARDGYVYLPRHLPEEDVLAARAAIFGRLNEVGEVAEPAHDGIFTGTSQRDELVTDRGTFWRSVSEMWALRRVSHGEHMHALMSDLLDEAAAAQDFLFLRPAGPGKRTPIHCDSPFFTRTTNKVLTAWIALGEVPVHQGPLFILEGSHQIPAMRAHYEGFDVARDTDRKAALDQSPTDFAREHGCRILTNRFGIGDVLVFDMFLMHGALDNVSSGNEIRLSCDVRYQAAAAPKDPRYFGPNPGGTTGAGYGELVGAKPLTEAWHVR